MLTFKLMSMKAEEVEDVLDELRAMGAVAEVQSGGRVPKYRHYAYEWLGVDKQGIAVMAELMLRGQQTVGELRSRAARMEPIADMAVLRPVLDSLKQKKLLLELTPPGRGQIVTHGLYKDRELEQLHAQAGEQACGVNAFEVPWVHPGITFFASRGDTLCKGAGLTLKKDESGCLDDAEATPDGSWSLLATDATSGACRLICPITRPMTRVVYSQSNGYACAD